MAMAFAALKGKKKPCWIWVIPQRSFSLPAMKAFKAQGTILNRTDLLE